LGASSAKPFLPKPGCSQAPAQQVNCRRFRHRTIAATAARLGIIRRPPRQAPFFSGGGGHEARRAPRSATASALRERVDATLGLPRPHRRRRPSGAAASAGSSARQQRPACSTGDSSTTAHSAATAAARNGGRDGRPRRGSPLPRPPRAFSHSLLGAVGAIRSRRRPCSAAAFAATLGIASPDLQITAAGPKAAARRRRRPTAATPIAVRPGPPPTPSVSASTPLLLLRPRCPHRRSRPQPVTTAVSAGAARGSAAERRCALNTGASRVPSPRGSRSFTQYGLRSRRVGSLAVEEVEGRFPGSPAASAASRDASRLSSSQAKRRKTATRRCRIRPVPSQGGTGYGRCLKHAGAEPLAAHLEQTEARVIRRPGGAADRS